MAKNIALIGFMGSGKSTVGRALARQIGVGFTDLDNYIESVVKLPIPQIFQMGGESLFRGIEQMALLSQCQMSNARKLVLSTGGGVILDSENRRRLQDDWIVVYLRIQPETALTRIEKDTIERPLLNVENPKQELESLMTERLPLYEEVANIVVDVDELNVNEIVADIISRLN